MQDTENKSPLFIIYDQNLTPCEASDSALKLQNITFDEFRYVNKKSQFFNSNLNQSMIDFCTDNEKTVSGMSLLNLDGHFYNSGFYAFFTRRYPLFSKTNSNKIIGMETVANPIEHIFYPEIASILSSRNLNIHNQVRTNFSTYFKEKRNQIAIDNWGLSRRELDCALLVMKGLTNSEISKELDLSSRTVESYIENIKSKMSITKKREIFDKMTDLLLTNFF